MKVGAEVTTEEDRSRSEVAPRKRPGLLLAGLVALLCLAVSHVLPLLSALLLAILVGIAVRNLGWVRPWAEAGLADKVALRLGVALLGLRLSIPEVIDLGAGVLLVIAVTVLLTYVLVLAAGRGMRIDRPTRVLIATGCAICGAAAVAAVAAVLPSREERGRGRGAASGTGDAAATAIATVTLFGTAALLVVPAVAAALGLEGERSGIWIGASIHEVGQVVAAAGLAGEGAMDTAVVTKLGRVALLAPLVVLVGWWENRATRQGTGGRAPLLPWFVAVFLVLVVARSALDLPGALLSSVDLVATFLLTVGMFGMGASVHLRTLLRTGVGALGLGAVAGVVSALVALAGVVAWA